MVINIKYIKKKWRTMKIEEKEIQKILSTILHDTKKPFNNLKMFLSLLKSKKNDPEFIENNANLLSKDAEKTIDVIRNLKEYFSVLKKEVVETNFGDLIKLPLKDFEKSLGDIATISSIKNEDYLAPFDYKIIRKGFYHLFSKSSELVEIETLKKIIVEGEITEDDAFFKLKFIGEKIINLINSKKFESVFFEEGSNGSVNDLKLAICHRFFTFIGCSFVYNESENEFELVIKIPLNSPA